VSGQSRLNSYQETVNARLEALLPPLHNEPRVLHEAMRYAALSPGKRIRPVLAMLCAEAAGGKGEDVLDAACAAEMIHAFSLIHDDLPAIDNDDLRRGQPTCHKKFGESVAILAGDALFALAFRTVAGWPDAVAILSSASLALVQGETLDVLSEGMEPSAERLEQIHRQKTGALIEAVCKIGGLAAGSQAHADQLADYGRHLGLAFQIADDILNVTASAKELGKSAGSDAAAGKLTYPAVFGLDEAHRAADEAKRRAVDALQGLPGPIEPLEELAEFTVSRRN
jgi:geranylgeranyl diphosphate synthase type II